MGPFVSKYEATFSGLSWACSRISSRNISAVCKWERTDSPPPPKAFRILAATSIDRGLSPGDGERKRVVNGP